MIGAHTKDEPTTGIMEAIPVIGPSTHQRGTPSDPYTTVATKPWADSDQEAPPGFMKSGGVAIQVFWLERRVSLKPLPSRGTIGQKYKRTAKVDQTRHQSFGRRARDSCEQVEPLRAIALQEIERCREVLGKLRKSGSAGRLRDGNQNSLGRGSLRDDSHQLLPTGHHAQDNHTERQHQDQE
jgi:hypothetical protein